MRISKAVHDNAFGTRGGMRGNRDQRRLSDWQTTKRKVQVLILCVKTVCEDDISRERRQCDKRCDHPATISLFRTWKRPVHDKISLRINLSANNG